MGIGVFGFCVYGTMAMEAALGLLGLLLGLLLRRLVRRRDQHLRQKWAGWFFWQWGRTVDPPRLLRPALESCGKHIKHSSQDMPMKHMNCQHTMTYRTYRAGQLVPAVLGGVWP